jgi:hypothetical protein
MARLAIFAIAVFLAAAAQAQWLNYPTPGLPRTPDGKVRLDAPAPRTPDGKPDLSGVWASDCALQDDGCFPRGSRFFDLARGLNADDVQMTPWAAAISKQREARNHVDDPYGYCLPPGTPRIDFAGAPFKILQTPQVTAILYETVANSTFRQVFTDGRAFPPQMEPTWLGYSIGRWDGDVFVVESRGFRDGGWLDTLRGRPHSDALHTFERFRRIDVGHMELAVTIDDPKAFVKPWTLTATLLLQADTDLIESSCEGHGKTMEKRHIDAPPPEPPSPR